MNPGYDGSPAATQGLYAAPLTKTEMAYRHIRREIIEGVLSPDTVLDQEALAVRLGLSTTPVRIAVLQFGTVVGMVVDGDGSAQQDRLDVTAQITL